MSRWTTPNPSYRQYFMINLRRRKLTNVDFRLHFKNKKWRRKSTNVDFGLRQRRQCYYHATMIILYAIRNFCGRGRYWDTSFIRFKLNIAIAANHNRSVVR